MFFFTAKAIERDDKVITLKGPFQWGIEGLEIGKGRNSCGTAIVVTEAFMEAAAEEIAELRGKKTLHEFNVGANEQFLKLAEAAGFGSAFRPSPLRYSDEGLESIGLDRGEGKWLELSSERIDEGGRVYYSHNIDSRYELSALIWAFQRWAWLVQYRWEEKQRSSSS